MGHRNSKLIVHGDGCSEIEECSRSFPDGSFDFRSTNFTKAKQLSNSRYKNIKRLLETFPQRKFILVADTTSQYES